MWSSMRSLHGNRKGDDYFRPHSAWTRMHEERVDVSLCMPDCACVVRRSSPRISFLPPLPPPPLPATRQPDAQFLWSMVREFCVEWGYAVPPLLKVCHQYKATVHSIMLAVSTDTGRFELFWLFHAVVYGPHFLASTHTHTLKPLCLCRKPPFLPIYLFFILLLRLLAGSSFRLFIQIMTVTSARDRGGRIPQLLLPRQHASRSLFSAFIICSVLP